MEREANIPHLCSSLPGRCPSSLEAGVIPCHQQTQGYQLMPIPWEVSAGTQTWRGGVVRQTCSKKSLSGAGVGRAGCACGWGVRGQHPGIWRNQIPSLLSNRQPLALRTSHGYSWHPALQPHISMQNYGSSLQEWEKLAQHHITISDGGRKTIVLIPRLVGFL